MKKLITIVAALLVVGTMTVQASISINLGITGGFLDHNGTTYPADLWAGGGLMQLIWSTVNAYSPSQISNPAGEEPGVLPGYVILWSGTLGNVDTWPDDQDGANSYDDTDVGGNILAGYLYARVFETALPVEGTWYASSLIYDSSTAPTNGSSLPDLPIDMTEGTDSFFADPPGARLQPLDHGQVTLVPEPSTLLLALAGVGMLVYRRFRK